MRTWIPAVLLLSLAAVGCGSPRATDFRVSVASSAGGAGTGDMWVRSCKMESSEALLQAGPSPDRSGRALQITADMPGPGARSSGVRCSAGGVAQVGYEYRTKWHTRLGWMPEELDGLWFGVERPAMGARGLQEFVVVTRENRVWVRRITRDESGAYLGEQAGMIQRISRPDANRDLWEVRLPLLPWEAP
ncbi:MAG TPA: hypothetical protein VFS92_04490 [Planctomycetota bacterium]|nr:hypothetical protein [Planctomycetota bacterium]